MRGLFDNFLFQIPSYQRTYAWEEGQLKDLWNDLERTLRESDAQSRRHFLGPITLHLQERGVWMSRNGERKFMRVANIVDGQQRTTTLLIFISSLVRARLSSPVLPDPVPADFRESDAIQFVQRLTDHYFVIEVFHSHTYDPKVSGYPRKLRRFETDILSIGDESSDDASGFLYDILLATNRSDIPRLRQRLKHMSGVATVPLGRMVDAAEFFDKQFTKYILNQKHEEALQLLDELADRVVSQDLRMCAYGTSDESLCAKAFDCLNNRGKPLNQLDVMKAFLNYKAMSLPQATDRRAIQNKTRVVWQYIYVLEAKFCLTLENESQLLAYHFMLIWSGHSNGAVRTGHGPGAKADPQEMKDVKKLLKMITGADAKASNNDLVNYITGNSLFGRSDKALCETLHFYLDTLWKFAHAVLPLMARSSTHKNNVSVPRPPLIVATSLSQLAGDGAAEHRVLVWPHDLNNRARDLLAVSTCYQHKNYLETLIPLLGALSLRPDDDPAPPAAYVACMDIFETHFFRKYCANLSEQAQKTCCPRGIELKASGSNGLPKLILMVCEELCQVDTGKDGTRPSPLLGKPEAEDIEVTLRHVGRYFWEACGLQGRAGGNWPHGCTAKSPTSELFDKTVLYGLEQMRQRNSETPPDYGFSRTFGLAGTRGGMQHEDFQEPSGGIAGRSWAQPLKALCFMYELSRLQSEPELKLLAVGTATTRPRKGKGKAAAREEVDVPDNVLETCRLLRKNLMQKSANALQIEHIVPCVAWLEKSELYDTWKVDLDRHLPRGSSSKADEKFKLVEWKLGNFMLVSGARNREMAKMDLAEKMQYYGDGGEHGAQTACEREVPRDYPNASNIKTFVDARTKAMLNFMDQRYDSLRGEFDILLDRLNDEVSRGPAFRDVEDKLVNDEQRASGGGQDDGGGGGPGPSSPKGPQVTEADDEARARAEPDQPHEAETEEEEDEEDEDEDEDDDDEEEEASAEKDEVRH